MIDIESALIPETPLESLGLVQCYFWKCCSFRESWSRLEICTGQPTNKTGNKNLILFSIVTHKILISLRESLDRTAGRC